MAYCQLSTSHVVGKEPGAQLNHFTRKPQVTNEPCEHVCNRELRCVLAVALLPPRTGGTGARETQLRMIQFSLDLVT